MFNLYTSEITEQRECCISSVIAIMYKVAKKTNLARIRSLAATCTINMMELQCFSPLLPHFLELSSPGRGQCRKH